MGKLILSMRDISKTFPGVKALDNAQFNIYEGEVMGFLGENGAGKSTMMKILSGVYTKDSGDILFEGEEFIVSNPKEAIDKGVTIIHQELNLVNNMAVYENIFLGREETLGIKLDKTAMIQKSSELLKKLNVQIDPRVKVSSLSIAMQQMVEIARALSVNSKIIIMDEPTDTLTSKEVKDLFEVIKTLKEQNKGIVYISHRLDEIEEICDRYCVLRDGKYVGERKVKDSNEAEMIQLMVGRPLDEQIPYSKPNYGDVSLKVEMINNKFLKDVSFFARQGEILGIAGLVGAGRTELAKTLFGAYKIDSGSISVNDTSVSLSSPRDGIENGIVYVSEDRKSDGLVLGMDVKSNITLSALNKFIDGIKINKQKEEDVSKKYVKEMNIRTPSIKQIVGNLSGGNQQKVSISKALVTNAEILILDEPTRGVDVGAKREIYQILNKLKEQGKTIIVISSDMPEILGLSDRILVMSDGKIMGELSREEATQEKIMHLIVKGGIEDER